MERSDILFYADSRESYMCVHTRIKKGEARFFFHIRRLRQRSKVLARISRSFHFSRLVVVVADGYSASLLWNISKPLRSRLTGDATDGGVVWDFMGCTRSLNAKPRSTAIRHSGLRLVHKLSRINGRRKDKIRFPRERENLIIPEVFARDGKFRRCDVSTAVVSLVVNSNNFNIHIILQRAIFLLPER